MSKEDTDFILWLVEALHPAMDVKPVMDGRKVAWVVKNKPEPKLKLV